MLERVKTVKRFSALTCSLVGTNLKTQYLCALKELWFSPHGECVVTRFSARCCWVATATGFPGKRFYFGILCRLKGLLTYLEHNERQKAVTHKKPSTKF